MKTLLNESVVANVNIAFTRVKNDNVSLICQHIFLYLQNRNTSFSISLPVQTKIYFQSPVVLRIDRFPYTTHAISLDKFTVRIIFGSCIKLTICDIKCKYVLQLLHNFNAPKNHQYFGTFKRYILSCYPRSCSWAQTRHSRTNYLNKLS